MNTVQKGFLSGMMQSFNSIGPMLDVAAVFSVIAAFSGIYLPLVMLLSFMLGYSTIFTLSGLSMRFVSNGGYFAYVGILSGKRAGLFTAIIYIVYSLMVVPDISLFEGGFLSSGLSYGGISFPLSAVILSFVFALSPILFTMTGIRKGLRYTVAAGFIEIAFVLTLSTFFLHGGTLTIKPFEITSDRIYYVWTGLVFGILAFSGSGSSVFISRNVSSPRKNIPRGIISSYTVSGLIMVISAYSLVIFLGNGGLLPYETTPYYIGTAIASRFGISALYALIAVVVFSGFNLCTSYLNAFLNAVETASDSNLFGKRMREKVQRNHYLIAVFAATVVSITAAELYTGFFNMFVVIAGAVSLSYICVHVVLNFSIVRNTKAMGKKLSAVSIVSSFALIAALYYSVDSNLSSDPATNYIVLAAVALAASVTLIMHLRPGYFMNVSLRSNDEENSI